MNASRHVYVHAWEIHLPRRRVIEWHNRLVCLLHKWSIPALRVTLGLIFLWFGALKLFSASPVLVILKQTCPFIPLHTFAVTLGAWEVLIGCGLIAKRALRFTLLMLCVHLTGTFVALFLAPSLFFQHESLIRLTVEGEFVAKNMVLLAAGMVIGGYEIKPVSMTEKLDKLRINQRADGEEAGELVCLNDAHEIG